MFRKKILLFFIVISLFFSFISIWQRQRAEGGIKGVELIVDYDDLIDFCRAFAYPKKEVLTQLKDCGVTTVAFNEVTLERLKLDGDFSVYRGSDLIADYRLKKTAYPSFAGLIDQGKITAEKIYIFIEKESFSEELSELLELYNGVKVNKLEIRAGKFLLETNGILDKDAIVSGIGFMEHKIKEINDIGFKIILRPENRGNLEAKNLEKIWAKINLLSEKYAVSGIIFGGVRNEVMGYPDLLDIDLKYLNCFKGGIGLVEIYQARQEQKGIGKIALAFSEKCVRVQSIPETYLEKLTPALAKEMFLLGIKERNIRWVYLRLFRTSFNGKSLLDTNLSYIRELGIDIKSSGFCLSKASVFSKCNTPFIFALIISLGVASGFLLLLSEFMLVNIFIEWAILIFTPVFLAFFKHFGKFLFFCKVLALLAGIIFSSLSLIYGVSVLLKLKEVKNLSSAVRRSTVYMIIITGLTLIGGIFVAALLNGPIYWLGIDKFKGVKALMVFPLILVFLWYYTKGSPHFKPLKKWLNEPVLIVQALLALILAIIGVIYIIRTGNTDTPDVGLERKVRILLSHLFLVRPRFKDVFIGFPALMLLIAKLSFKRFSGAGIFLILAAIGQVDIIDSLAHLHTPLFITALRIFNGVFIGWFVGLVLLIIYYIGVKKEIWN